MLFEDALRVAKTAGLKVLETGLVNSAKRQLIDVVCKAGHSRRMPRNKFSNRPPQNCPVCLKEQGPDLDKILTDPKIKTRLDEGYHLKKAFSEDHEIQLEVVCPQGHTYSIAKWKFTKGTQCGSCSGKNRDLTFFNIKQEMEAEGFEVLSKEYQNQYQKLHLIDPDGNEQWISADSWKRGYRSERGPTQQTRDRTIEEVKKDFEAEGYQLLETKFINVKTKMRAVCPKGHEFRVHWNHWKDAGVRCSVCFGTPMMTLKEIQEHPETIQSGYQALRRERIGARLGCVFLCPKGHEWTSTLPDFFSKKYRCSSCNPKSSLAELEFLEEVKKTYPSARKSLDFGFEIDIYIPELKLGIEYCGLYWHCEKEKQPNAHKDKFLKAQKNGIKLLTIFEDEWFYKKEIVLRRILRSKKISARETQFKEISKVEADKFFEENHLQGKSATTTKQHFGLFYLGSLVGAIAYGPHHRKDTGEWVLSRLCFGEFDIVGGTEKLFKNSLRYLPKVKLISWSDNRYSNGSVYARLGFIKEEDLGPDYSYVKPGHSPIRVSKQSMKKTKEEQASGKTEHELRLAQDWYRIYDCGKIRWAYPR
jgi:hypothetical protein